MSMNKLFKEPEKFEEEKNRLIQKFENYYYLNFSDIFIPFSTFYEKKVSLEINSDIPFKNKNRKFQKIMRKEFLIKEHNFRLF